MVAVIAGKGVGLERSSAWVLGELGQLGSAALGRGGEKVYVNAASGNLVITRQDEFLIGQGPDLSLDHTYNSYNMIGWDGDNNDQWQIGAYRKITSIPTNYGATGSSVRRIDWDGSDTLYLWKASENAYVTTDGPGAYDTLTRSGTVWTWTDGDTQVKEYYDQNQGGRITSTVDQDLNTLTYAYDAAGLMTQVTNQNGEYTKLVYGGFLGRQLQRIETFAPGAGTTPTLTRTRYAYNGLGRLVSVTLDLSPNDNSVADGKSYVTNYTYDGTSMRIIRIEQTDGTRLDIGYTQFGADYKVTSLTQTVASGVTRVTTIAYTGNSALVTQNGTTPTMVVWDTWTSPQSLNALYRPAVQGTWDSFSYNTNGDVIYHSEGPYADTSYEYDSRGNQTKRTDASGTVARTYSLKNELLTETRYARPDPDGYGPGQPGEPMTTRYAYDLEGHLRYVVGAGSNGTLSASVTEYRYSDLGNRLDVIEYPANGYSLGNPVSGNLAPGQSISLASLDSWVQGIADKSSTRRVTKTYDPRGNVVSESSYSRINADGSFDTSSELSRTFYVYDQAGNLLTRQVVGSAQSEVFVYDGLNRIVSSTDFNSAATTIAFNDSTQSKVVTLANGLAQTSTYNRAGELIGYAESGPGVTTAATQYRYDNVGRLRMTTDALGQRDYILYDELDRKVADIDTDGSLVEYRYDRRDNVTSFTRYANKVSAGNLAALVDANGNPTSLSLDAIRPAEQGDDRWTWQLYDDARRLVRTIDATGATTVFTYDGASRLLSTRQYANALSAADLAKLKAYPTSINHHGEEEGWQQAYDAPDEWYFEACDWGYAAAIDGLPAYRFTATTWYEPAAIEFGAAHYGNGDSAKITTAFTLKAVGNENHHEFGYYNPEEPDDWFGDATAVIVSGPGTLTRSPEGQWQVFGLSNSQATRIELVRTLGAYEVTQFRLFIKYRDPSVDENGVLNKSLIISNASMMVTNYFPPALPAENGTNDRLVRSFYDNDDRLTGTLDAEGNLTKIVYDKAGRKMESVAYWGATNAALRTTGTFAELLGSITVNNAKDIHNYFVYDARGLLRAEIDGEGDLTRYAYTPLGDVSEIVTGQKLDPAALLTTPPTFANLPSAPSGTVLQTTAYSRNLHGQVLTETRTLTGGTSSVTSYGYDNMRRLVSTTTQSGGPDSRIDSRRYDLRGRLTGELSGIGSALIEALGPDPEPEVTDSIWGEYATFYGYDLADRLISTSNANGGRTLYYYDADDRLAYQVDAVGAVVEYRYNALGERSETIAYAARIDSETLWEMTGGRASDVTGVITALANASNDSKLVAFYDKMGRLKLENDLLGSYTTRSYNSLGDMILREDAFGESPVTPGLATEIDTSFVYDRRGLLKTEIVDSAAGGKAITTTYGYDAFGRLVDLNAAGQTTHIEHDRAGRLASTSDALDNTTFYHHDARGNLVAVEDALGYITRYVYDQGGRRIFAVDAHGGVVESSYDGDGRLLVTRAYSAPIAVDELPVQIGADAVVNALAQGPDDRITRYAYDKNGRLRFVVDGELALSEHRYDDTGNAVRTISYSWPVSAGSTYTIDDLEAQVEAHEGLGSLTRIARSVHDAAGREAFSIDASGVVTSSAYDSAGRLIKQVAFATAYPDGDDPSLYTMQEWASGNAHADDRTSRAVYDRKGRMVYSIDAAGFVTEYRHTRTGEVTTQIRYADAYAIADGATQASVKALLPSAIPQSAITTEFYYDSAGRLEGTRDPLGNVTMMILDQRGQAVSTTVTAWGTWETFQTDRVYDALGRLESETRAANTDDEVATAYGYNELGQVTSIIYAAGTTEACETARTYDRLGRLESETRAVGEDEEVTTSYGYTAFGEVETVTVAVGTPDQSVTSRTYHETGRLESETRAAGLTYSVTAHFDYDLLGREIVETDPEGFATTRLFDALGRLVSVRRQVDAVPANDLVTTSEYDGFGNLVKVTDPRLNSTYLYYDALGRVELQVDPEGFATSTTYEGFLREPETVTRHAAKVIGAPSVSERPTVVIGSADATTHFEYDKLGRLTAVTDAENHDESYQLDLNGNRTRLTNKLDGITDYTYDKLGRMKTRYVDGDVHQGDGTLLAAGVLTEYEYDLRGNLRGETEAVGLAEERHTGYTYDKLDRLTEIDRPDIVSVTIDLTMSTTVLAMKDSFAYDKRGNVIESAPAGGPRAYAWYDALDRRAAELSETGLLTKLEYDANGNVEAHKAYGDAVAFPSSRPAAAPDPINSANVREIGYDYDRSNRLIAVTIGTAATVTGEWNGSGYATSTGAIARQRDYDAAGNVIREYGDGIATRGFFDKAGREIGTLDAEGYLTVWERDAEGNVLKETRYADKPAGAIVQTSSVADLHAAATASANDRITEFTYDRNGRRTSEKRLNVEAWTLVGVGGALEEDTAAAHIHSKISYEYNAFGQVVRRTEANEDETLFFYDEQGRLTETRSEAFDDHLGASVTPTTVNLFDSRGNVVRMVANKLNGAAGDAHVTTYSYDGMGWLQSMTDATGAVHVYFRDGGGRVVLDRYNRKKAAGNTLTEGVTSVYDKGGRLIRQSIATKGSQIPPAIIKWGFGDTTNFRYNVHGEMIGRGLNKDGNFDPAYQESYDYDSVGRLWRTTAEDGAIKVMVHDRAGNATLTLSSAGGDLSTLLAIEDAIETLDGAGDTDLGGAVTTIAQFDKRGQQLASIEPDRQLDASQVATITRSRSFNAFGEVASETDARNNTINFTYNRMGRLVRKESPQASWTDWNGTIAAERPTERYFHDVAGRLIGSEDAAHVRTRQRLLAGTGHAGAEALVTANYHADNARAQTLYDVFGDARIQRNEYWIDGGPNDTGKTDLLLEYDKAGRLAKVEHLGRLLTETYEYDQLGQRIRREATDGADIDLAETTEYDRQGRVAEQTAFGGDLTTYSYAWNGTLETDGLGTFGAWIKTTTNAAGEQATETVDYFNRTIARSDFGDNEHAFGFDLAGRLTSHSVPGETLSFTYYNTGRISSISNGAGNSSSYRYDAAGNQLAEKTWKAFQLVQDATASYDALGRMIGWAEAGSATSPAASIAWEYDRVGNVRRKHAAYSRLDGAGTPYWATTQDNWFLYDVMNRVTTDRGFLIGVDGQGQTVTGDAARGFGTVRRQLPGVLPALNRIGEVGADYEYDAAGRRKSMAVTKVRYEGSWPPNAYFRENKEMYDYAADGNLSTTRVAIGAETFANYAVATVPAAAGNGTVLATFTRDALGRITAQSDWINYSTGNAAYSRFGVIYNAKGQITQEHTSVRRDSNDLYVSHIVNDFGPGSGAGYFLGAVVSSVSTNLKNSTPESTATTTNTLAWRDGVVTNSTTVATVAQQGPNTNYTTSYGYGAMGQVESVSIADGVPSTVTFVNDMAGQIIRRDESGGGSNGNPHEVWYRFGGKQLGYTGNNGTLDTDYAQSAVHRQITIDVSGHFRFGSHNPSSYADFSQSLEPINSYSQGSAGGAHVAQDGDTLESIATSLWGNASLWYKLAEANGLSGSGALTAGQRLVVPTGVSSNANSAETFKPYDPVKALGDLSPTTPKPPKKPGGCGMIGQLLVMALAVAITLIIKVPVANLLQFGSTVAPVVIVNGAFVPVAAGTAASIAGAAITGAIASAASQGIGVATGLQDKFSWKSVAMAGITAGIAQAIPGGQLINGAGKFVNDAARGALANSLSQGVAVATGLQKKFDWAGLAAAGIITGIAGAASRSMPDKAQFNSLGQMTRAASFQNLQLSGAAGAFAGAAVRSLVTGTSFGDNIIAVLPDVIGTTIGNLIGEAINRPRPRQATHAAQSENPGFDSEMGGWAGVSNAPYYNIAAQGVIYAPGLSTHGQRYEDYSNPSSEWLARHVGEVRLMEVAPGRAEYRPITQEMVEARRQSERAAQTGETGEGSGGSSGGTANSSGGTAGSSGDAANAGAGGSNQGSGSSSASEQSAARRDIMEAARQTEAARSMQGSSEPATPMDAATVDAYINSGIINPAFADLPGAAFFSRFAPVTERILLRTARNPWALGAIALTVGGLHLYVNNRPRSPLDALDPDNPFRLPDFGPMPGLERFPSPGPLLQDNDGGRSAVNPPTPAEIRERMIEEGQAIAAGASGTPGPEGPGEEFELFSNRYPEDTPGHYTPINLRNLPNMNSRSLIYVVREDGRLIVARGNAGWGHVDLAAGQPVRAAGQFGIANGRIRFINNASGHYTPSGASAQYQALQAFRNAGFRVDNSMYIPWVQR